MSSQMTNVYVRNIPESWTNVDLIAVFSKYGAVTSAKVLSTDTGASRGMGFVRFKEHNDATLAISQLEGFVPEGASKGITCKFARDQIGGKSDTPRSVSYTTVAKTASDGRSNAVEEFPIAPEGTDPLNVYVVDLPLHYSKEQLQAIYEPFGNLISCTILSDPNTGVSRGIGFARFSHVDCAARSLKETQNMMVEGATKPILVRFARDTSKKRSADVSVPPVAAVGGPVPYPYGAYPYYPYPPQFSPYPYPYPSPPPSLHGEGRGGIDRGALMAPYPPYPYPPMPLPIGASPPPLSFAPSYPNMPSMNMPPSHHPYAPYAAYHPPPHTSSSSPSQNNHRTNNNSDKHSHSNSHRNKQ